MRLNYGGSTYLHRLITSVLPKMVKDEQALHAILQFVADDTCGILGEGVRDAQGNVYTACCLQICGDWQWLVKAQQELQQLPEKARNSTNGSKRNLPLVPSRPARCSVGKL